MDSGSSHPVQPGSLAAGAERAFVRLTRFTIAPDGRPALVEAARAIASFPATAEATECTFLVELDDGDWLQISISSSRAGPASDAAYLDLAEGIVGDEDGMIVASRPPVTWVYEHRGPTVRADQESQDLGPGTALERG